MSTLSKIEKYFKRMGLKIDESWKLNLASDARSGVLRLEDGRDYDAYDVFVPIKGNRYLLNLLVSIDSPHVRMTHYHNNYNRSNDVISVLGVDMTKQNYEHIMVGLCSNIPKCCIRYMIDIWSPMIKRCTVKIMRGHEAIDTSLIQKDPVWQTRRGPNFSHIKNPGYILCDECWNLYINNKFTPVILNLCHSKCLCNKKFLSNVKGNKNFMKKFEKKANICGCRKPHMSIEK